MAGRRGQRPRRRRFPRAGRPAGRSPRSPGAGSRCAPTVGCGLGSCGGAGCRTPGCSVCSRTPATQGPTCTAATPRHRGSTRTAVCIPGWSNGPAPSGRCSFATTTRATSAGATTWPTKPRWPPTTPTLARVHRVKESRCARASSRTTPPATTINNPRVSPQPQVGQARDRQPVRQGWFAAVGPRMRQRHLPVRGAGTHKHRVRAAALDEQHCQPLTPQRMKRMRDNDETQIVTAQPVTMPPPSAHPAFGSLRDAASVSPPHAPEGESNFPTTSDSRPCTGLAEGILGLTFSGCG